MWFVHYVICFHHSILSASSSCGFLVLVCKIAPEHNLEVCLLLSPTPFDLIKWSLRGAFVTVD